ncbi:hypothetical protein CBW65_01645 [Tumebacillus avium]|uniref:Uncharacterized protein n=1 Tax=Tumebacillus avium TaxID=1903704 RepID=A0A1Y0IKK9_9BACL|nr:hypothetical protein [Tumebacillus avium]ARU59904.1 hypothetical protein CBW65_01645 [Tumebacillus avium]
MNFYHWWIYENIFNTTWFVWTFVIFILAFNIFSPVIIWLTFSGRKLKLQKKLLSKMKDV